MMQYETVSVRCAAHIRYGAGNGQPSVLFCDPMSRGNRILARCQERRSGYKIREYLETRPQADCPHLLALAVA